MSDESHAANSNGKRKRRWRVACRVFMLLVIVLLVAAFIGWRVMLKMPGESFQGDLPDLDDSQQSLSSGKKATPPS